MIGDVVPVSVMLSLPRNILPISGSNEKGERRRRAGISAILSSTMLDVKIDRQEQTDLFEQVAAEIRRAIAEGEAKPGERLPPARDLAAVLGVNTNTVLRSLRLLRDEGLLEFRRGRGIHVAGTPERGAVLARARELVRFARQQGYRTDELIKIIESVG
jgi:GntR family transcriptional regulator